MGVPGIDRLAETEYAVHAAPHYTTATRFGRFVHDPRFPYRHDANQLLDVRCAPGEVPALLALLDALFEDTGRPFRKMTVHDPDTVRHLIPELTERGWSCRRENMMPLRRASSRAASSLVAVAAVPFEDPDGHRATIAKANHGHLRALHYRQAQDPRLGGEALIGYLGGHPAGTTGWFVVDGVARFRPVSTIATYRRQGVATTLIRYVQDHPTVSRADCLVIYCSDDGPVPLYERLGFVCTYSQWSCFLKLPGYPVA